MKVVVALRDGGWLAAFEGTLRLLCERGHQVHLAFQGTVDYTRRTPDHVPGQLAALYSTFSYGELPLRYDGWGLLGRQLRGGLDYLRLLGPAGDAAPWLRARAAQAAPADLRARAASGLCAGAPGRRLLAAWLRAQEQALPTDPQADDLLRGWAPDVLVVTPLVEPGAPQAEYLRSARALGIRTAYCVAGWDHLAAGLIHGRPDLVAVWNEPMRQQAIAEHGIAADRVVVTGAPPFDPWFDGRPASVRAAFCARVGLPAERPYLLYACSSPAVVPDEVALVRRWLDGVRRSPRPELRDAGVVVRPHPRHAAVWAGVDLGPAAVVWLRPHPGSADMTPAAVAAGTDDVDAIHHCAAVVTMDTTAAIEGASAGRPVLGWPATAAGDGQPGSRHPLDAGELLQTAATLDEHLAQLAATVAGPVDDERSWRVVEAFVRPFGRAAAATPRLVRAIEDLAARPARPVEPESAWRRTLRERLAGRAAALDAAARSDPESYAARLAVKAAREARRRERQAERSARLVERAMNEQERRQARAEVEQVSRQQRIERLVGDFHHMGEVDRRSVLRAVVDAVPADSFLELMAANPSRRLDYDGADIRLRVTNKSETFRVKACAKEPFTIEWIHSHVGAGEVLYDIGANVGAYSLVAAMQPGGGATVFGFEASYANLAAFSANVALNGLGTQVTPLPVALSDRTGMTVFNLRDLEPGAARHGLGDAPPEDGPAVFRQPVMMFRLDDLVEQFGLPLPNHVKLDVDGGELAVLDGAARTLAAPSLRSMLVEVSASLSAAVTEALEQRGLRLASKISVTNKQGESPVWYGLFERGESGAVRETTGRERTVAR